MAPWEEADLLLGAMRNQIIARFRLQGDAL